MIVTIGPFDKLNNCTIIRSLNLWIAPIKAIAGIDEKSVQKTSILPVEVGVLNV